MPKSLARVVWCSCAERGDGPDLLTHAHDAHDRGHRLCTPSWPGSGSLLVADPRWWAETNRREKRVLKRCQECARLARAIAREPVR